MGDDLKNSAPFFFQKPQCAIIDTSATSETTPIRMPRRTSDLHHEAELVLAIGKPSTGPVPVSIALSHISAVGVGCDLTRRDLQAVAKEKRRPWDDAKGFEGGAPVGGLVEVKAGEVR